MYQVYFDDDYVRRLTNGDPEIERHFVTYFDRLLWIKLRRRLRTIQAAEDIRQEVYLRVFRALRRKGLANPERLGAFVSGVCSNVLLEHYRANTRDPILSEEIFDTPITNSDPEDEYVTQERNRGVHQVLERLSTKDRDILRLVFLEEQEKDDVCRMYSVDRNHLRVLLHRAKHRFREQLPQYLATH